MWEEETLHEAAQTSACWECLSGWAKWGESDPWPIRGSWAVPFAALLPGNNISLEGKQNGGHRADRLAPVAAGKTAAVYSAQSMWWPWWCSGETVGPANYSWRSRMSWHDGSRSICLTFYISKDPHNYNKGYQIQSSVPSGADAPNQPAGRDTEREEVLYSVLPSQKINTHM